jgi:hypothetical protein
MKNFEDEEKEKREENRPKLIYICNGQMGRFPSIPFPSPPFYCIYPLSMKNNGNPLGKCL